MPPPLSGLRPRAALPVVALSAAFLGALWLGRATRVEGSQLSLVWPAAAVGFWWLVRPGVGRGGRALDVALLLALSALGNHLTGAPPTIVLLAALSNVVNSAAAAVVYARLNPSVALARPTDLLALGAAATAGAVLSAAVGPVGLYLLQGGDLPLMTTSWTVRNAVSTVLLGAVIIRVLTRGSAPEVVHARRAEGVALAVTSVGVHLLVLAPGQQLPLTFALVPLAVWAGMRLSTTWASLHVLLSSTLVIGMTLEPGGGPLHVGSALGDALLAQSLLAVLGLLTLLVALHRDRREVLIADLRAAEARIGELVETTARSRDRLAAVLAAATEQSIIATDERGRIELFNPGAERMLGWRAEEVLGRSVTVVHDLHELADRTRELGLPSGSHVLGHGVAVDRAATGRWTYRARDGRPIPVRLSVTRVQEDGRPRGYIGIATDISRELAAEEALRQQALHDPLTGLPNRTLLLDRLEAALAATRRGGPAVGILFGDLDGFKAVNDRSGHRAGDELLIEVGRRMRGVVRPGDTVARVGGDEFVVLCPDVDEQLLADIAERAGGAVAQPIELSSGTASVTISLGRCLAAHPVTADEALQRADAAMYHAKRTREHAGRPGLSAGR